MELKYIDIADLGVSAANMRAGKKAPDIADILPSVRARGVLVPLIVRARPAGEKGEGGSGEGGSREGGSGEGGSGEGSPAGYEIVAGRRRYHAALAVAGEGAGLDKLPCAVIEAGDDAAALEASLIENIARADPDEVTRWETFTRLVREGRSVEAIAITFGLTEVQVKRTLALGNLLPRIRTLYRAGEIDAVTVRHLTLASKERQREWLALADDREARAPVGQQLKAWLLGGASISTEVALFDLEGFEGEIVADLFGEERWFADAAQFWAAQNAAIEERAAAYREAGWSEVVVLEAGEWFHSWEYERRARTKGGKVYVAVSHRGEVAFHEGYVTLREARRSAQPEPTEKPSRPEVTAATNDYIDLHRHATVRAQLAEEPGVALRVAVAHVIVGSPLWHVRVEPQRSPSEAVAESVEACASEAAFDAKRREVLALLGFDSEAPTVTGGAPEGLAALFVRLTRLDDTEVLAVLAVAMGETLDAHGEIVDALGLHLALDMAPVWRADEVLLDLIRDREVLLALVAELAGQEAAEANAKEPGKALKTIVRDCLAGANGRSRPEGWVPRWLRFPASGYTQRGGVGAVARSAAVARLFAQEAEMPEAEPAASEAKPEPVRAAA